MKEDLVGATETMVQKRNKFRGEGTSGKDKEKELVLSDLKAQSHFLSKTKEY